MANKQEQEKFEMITTEKYRNIKWSDIPDASEVIDLEQFAPPVLKAAEHMDEEFILLDCTDMEGETGQYLLCDVYDPKSGEVILLSTGSMLVVPAFRTMRDHKLLPLRFKFEALGRTYKVVSAK